MEIISSLIIDLLKKKELVYFQTFLSQYPKNAVWYLLSDYCIDDSTKKYDSFTFTLLANHDKLENIKNYINSVAPKDLKSTRNASMGLIQYINSPVCFHFSLIIKKNENLLAQLFDKIGIEKTINEYIEFLNLQINNDKANEEYFRLVYNNLKLIRQELTSKSFNKKLLKKIFLTSSLGAAIIYLLKENSDTPAIRWISDRDAIIQKYNNFVLDNTFITYKILTENNKLKKSDPQIELVLPQITGINKYDELNRIPDYIAGSVSSLDWENRESINNIKDKHKEVLYLSFMNSKNQAFINLTFKNEILSVYNYKWIART